MSLALIEQNGRKYFRSAAEPKRRKRSRLAGSSRARCRCEPCARPAQCRRQRSGIGARLDKLL
jgi:hypothetical protein